MTALEGRRKAEEHAAFRQRHVEWLEGTEDAGLLAFRRFLDAWAPDRFAAPLWPEEMRDQNIVFTLADEYRERFLHDRPAARELWRRIGAESASDPQICLVTGEAGPVARLHPSIKGVWGAQSSGASLVSFNLDAFTSYGHDQGDNTPVSEAAAFSYTTALNRFLAKDSDHRIQIGDASTVFWADASGKVAVEAESIFAALFVGDPAAEDAAQAKEIGIQLERIRQGQHLSQVAPSAGAGCPLPRAVPRAQRRPAFGTLLLGGRLRNPDRQLSAVSARHGPGTAAPGRLAAALALPARVRGAGKIGERSAQPGRRMDARDPRGHALPR